MFCLLSIASISCALADAISPNINNDRSHYSSEKPNSSFFGTSIAGKLTEASHLRFMGEQALDDARFDEAITKLGKAVQLDSGDPGGHILYARALTAKFRHLYRSTSNIDRELLTKCINEWKLIWHHDADQVEQAEAKHQARQLMRIARSLEKQDKERQKQNRIAEVNAVPQ